MKAWYMVLGHTVACGWSKCGRCVVGVALVAIVLGGCSAGGGSSTTTPEATRAPTVEPSTVPVMTLGEVTWSTTLAEDGEPVENLDVFSRDAVAIYAAVPVESVAAGEVLTAQWSLDGAPIEGIDSTLEIDEASASGWVSFALTWEGETLWPVGTLGVTVAAGSGATTTGEVRIEST